MKEINNANIDFEQILVLIQEARSRVYTKANAELVLLYFNVGKVVSHKVEAGNWGENTVQELANFIAAKQPELSGFNRRGLYRMKQFYETYSNPEFVLIVFTQLQMAENDQNTKVSELGTLLQNYNVSELGTHYNEQIEESIKQNLLAKISWSNHRLILSKTKSNEEKIFYLMLSIKEKYSSTELERILNTATYERTMMSNQLVSSIKSHLPQNLFKDPYVFEFLNLPDRHSEKDFEKAITLNLQKFILEIGKGFTYMGNQYRLQVGNKDYYTDLLFYHRDLQCLVLFELKIEDFAPEFLGKLNFYLEALDRDVKRPNENPSIGILLCKGKDTEVVEYAMARNTSPAIIADYETKLIDKKLLAKKLHQLAEIFNKEME